MWAYATTASSAIMARAWVMAPLTIKSICSLMGWGLMCFTMCLAALLVAEVLMRASLGDPTRRGYLHQHAKKQPSTCE